MQAAMRRLMTLSILALAAGLAIDSTAAQAGSTSGVSFTNGGKSTLYVYTRYGAGSSCDDMRTSKTFEIKAGATAHVDSGDSKVCYCIALPNRTAGCPGGWQEIPAGGSLTFE